MLWFSEEIWIQVDRLLLASGLEELYNGRAHEEVIEIFIGQQRTANQQKVQVPKQLNSLREEACSRIRSILTDQLTAPESYTTSTQTWYYASSQQLPGSSDLWHYCTAVFHLSETVADAWDALLQAVDIPLKCDHVSDLHLIGHRQ